MSRAPSEVAIVRVPSKSGTIAPIAPDRPSLDRDPLALYLAQLRSKASRRSIISALNRCARIFDALDIGDSPENSTHTAKTYPWGESGALTYAKAQAAIALLAEEDLTSLAQLALAALRGVTRQAHNLGLISAEERRRIDDIKAPRSSGEERGRRLQDDEILRLATVCRADSSPRGRRDAAIFAVMLGHGLRRAEVSALNIDDWLPPKKIGEDPNVITVRHGKGDKWARVPGPPDVAPVIAAWLEVRRTTPGALFLSAGGRGRALDPTSRLTDSGVYLVCQTRGDEARVDFTPHDLRRTFITVFLERTGDLALAQRAARHADPKTTAKYDKRGETALLRAFAGARSGVGDR